MAVRTITTKLAIEGEAEYRARVKALNAELRLHKSELEKVEAQYHGSANTMEALGAKHNALKGQLDTLSKVYSEQSAMLEKAEQALRLYAYQVDQSGGKLERAKAKLEELKRSAGDTAEQEAKLTAEIERHQKALDAARTAMQQASNSVVDYQKKINYTARDQAKVKSELADTEKYLSEAQESWNGCATSIDQYGKKIKQAKEETVESQKAIAESKEAIHVLAEALIASGIASGLREIAGAMAACVDASVEFESAMTGVFKTVDGTGAQLAAISDGIQQMSTEIPATTTEIAAVAEAAGQLGIATENVLAFSRVMLDLGESTNLSADEAATALARFANITGTAAADYERMGSAIVALGNNFETTEAEIAEMSTRLASAGTLAGLAESDILALATAMSSVGIEAEAGGTAMTQTLTAIEKAVASGGANLEQFARIAGMSAAEFSAAWETDAIRAIQAFISGLGRLEEQGESATLVLDEMGLSGVRQGNMLKSLALASETLSGAITLSSQAWEENTALAAEVGQRYATLESQLQMAQNAYNNVKIAIGDELAPALRELAGIGTDTFTWAAEFIEQNPILVQAITATAAALGTFVAGITGLAAIKNLIPLIKTFGAVLTASQIGVVGVVAAVGGLVTALGSLVASIKESTEESREMMETFKASREEYEALSESIQQQRTDVDAMVGALSSLSGNAKQSAVSQQAILSIVEQLNAAIPELNLAFDAETNSLNMTTQAISDAATKYQQLEADTARYNELAMEQGQILAEIQRLEQLKSETPNTGLASAEWAQIVHTLTDLEQALEANQEEMTLLDAAIGKTTEELKGAGNAISDVDEVLQKQIDEINSAIASAEELEQATRSLTNEQKLLSDALEEQAESGALSVDTTLDLIDAGYAAALAVDEETSAVTLNKAAYIEIAKAKIDDQIASLETQRTSVQTAIQLQQEAKAAIDDAWAFAELKRARDAIDDLEGQDRAYAAQIAALEKLKASLDSYTGSSQTAARTMSSTSKTIQTQAEKDLAKYKELRAALDHEKAMDLVSEQDYYARLKEYREQYLTDEDNLDEYRRITEQIYSFDKALADKEAALWEEQTDVLVGELEERVKAILDGQSRMEQDLAGYGDLFRIENDQMSLENLQSQIDAINEYESALNSLKEREISAGLMNEVLGMDVDEATEYAKQLISMTEEQWDEYNALWEEKQKRAIEVAQQFYQDQLDALQSEYDDKLGQALGELTDTAYTSGQDTAQGLIDGLASKESALYAKARSIADEMSRILSDAYADSGDADGSHAGGLPYVPYDGYLAELHKGERVLTAAEAREYISRSLPSSYEMPRAGVSVTDLQAVAAATVNAMGMQNMGSSRPIELNATITMDGAVVARKQFRYNQAEAQRHGKSLVQT